MMTQQVELTLATFKCRVRSFQDDNYLLLVSYYSPELSYAKLKHRTNGNVVEVSANLCSDFMQQKTNGKVTYSGRVQP